MSQSNEQSRSVEAAANLTSWLAKRRGLPILIGVVLFFVGGTLEFFNVLIDSQFLALVEVFTRNTGILLALVGILLLEPLGT